MATPPPPEQRRDEFALDPRQCEIHRRLQLIGPEPAEYFFDCCRIMSGAAGVRSQTHLAAHLLREIEGRMHEVFEPMVGADARARIKAEKDEAQRAKIEEASRILELDEQTTEQWLARTAAAQVRAPLLSRRTSRHR